MLKTAINFFVVRALAVLSITISEQFEPAGQVAAQPEHCR
jgi:hypothetical protein